MSVAWARTARFAEVPYPVWLRLKALGEVVGSACSPVCPGSVPDGEYYSMRLLGACVSFDYRWYYEGMYIDIEGRCVFGWQMVKWQFE